MACQFVKAFSGFNQITWFVPIIRDRLLLFWEHIKAYSQIIWIRKRDESQTCEKEIRKMQLRITMYYSFVISHVFAKQE